MNVVDRMCSCHIHRGEMRVCRGLKKPKKNLIVMIRSFGAEGGTRTHTLLRAADFESAASTDSATSAEEACPLYVGLVV